MTSRQLDERQQERRRILFAPIPTPSLGATTHSMKAASGGFGGPVEHVYSPARGWSGGRRRQPVRER